MYLLKTIYEEKKVGRVAVGNQDRGDSGDSRDPGDTSSPKLQNTEVEHEEPAHP